MLECNMVWLNAGMLECIVTKTIMIIEKTYDTFFDLFPCILKNWVIYKHLLVVQLDRLLGSPTKERHSLLQSLRGPV